MKGPTLTKREVTAILEREIGSLGSLGTERLDAIQTVARKYRVDPERVAWLLGVEPITEGEA
jgi:hypothetical protein